MDRYVFPDGELATLATMGAHAERAGYEQRDVESLREHYAITLRHWVAGGAVAYLCLQDGAADECALKVP